MNELAREEFPSDVYAYVTTGESGDTVDFHLIDIPLEQRRIKRNEMIRRIILLEREFGCHFGWAVVAHSPAGLISDVRDLIQACGTPTYSYHRAQRVTIALRESSLTSCQYTWQPKSVSSRSESAVPTTIVARLPVTILTESKMSAVLTVNPRTVAQTVQPDQSTLKECAKAA